MRRAARGFTLIELLIVVAVIAIIMGMGLPNLLNAKRAANEASAIASLRGICSACEQYRVSADPRSYPADLAALTIAGGAPMDFIDARLASGVKSDYVFNLAGAGTTWQAWAAPLSFAGGGRAFYTDQTGVIRQVAGLGPAGAADAPLD